MLNDQVEAEVIARIFGSPATQPLINSTKGLTGHMIGASGALETAVTAMSIKHGIVHRNLIENPMDNLRLPLVNESCTIKNAITASYGFGGHNAALLLGNIT